MNVKDKLIFAGSILGAGTIVVLLVFGTEYMPSVITAIVRAGEGLYHVNRS